MPIWQTIKTWYGRDYVYTMDYESSVTNYCAYLTKAARAGLPLLTACLAMSANDTEQDEDCNFLTISVASSSPSDPFSFTLKK